MSTPFNLSCVFYEFINYMNVKTRLNFEVEVVLLVYLHIVDFSLSVRVSISKT